MTYEECLFMLTEINMHKFGKQSAQPILKNAIKASVERVCLKTIGVIDSTSNNIVLGIPDTSAILKNYISLQGTIDTISVSNDDAWKRIFEQKFIALFLQAEVWSDYRRTSKYVQDVDGLPIIVPREGTVLPRRYPYTFNETNYNTSTPQDQGIFTKNWWDVP